jgi:hypothetical protein
MRTRRPADDAAAAQRDAQAAEFVEIYPLADLAARIAANNAEIAGLHPSGDDGVVGAEVKARDFGGRSPSDSSIPYITQHMRLPAFKYAPQQPFAWPPTMR